MHTLTVPWKVLASHVGVGMLTEGWTLDEEAPPGGEVHCFRVAVAFDTPFDAVPVVQLGLTGFDLDQRDSARVSLKATQVTPSGFQAEVWSWAGTRVYSVEFHWLAIGA